MHFAVTTVARNPFARGEYRREIVVNTHRRFSCRWCGQQPARLYTYTWKRDDRTSTWRDHVPFCNLKCHDDYHG